MYIMKIDLSKKKKKKKKKKKNGGDDEKVSFKMAVIWYVYVWYLLLAFAI